MLAGMCLFFWSLDGNDSMKSEPYPRSKLRHRSDWNLAHDSVDCKYLC